MSGYSDDNDVEDDSPPAFRATDVLEEEVEDVFNSLESEDVDDSLIQAVIHDQGSEAIFQSDIEKALALSRESAGNNPFLSNTDTVISKKPDVGVKSIPVVARGLSDRVTSYSNRSQLQYQQEYLSSGFDLTPRAGELTSIHIKQELAKMNTNTGGNSEEYNEEVKMLIERGLLSSAAQHNTAGYNPVNVQGISDIVPPPLARDDSEEMYGEGGGHLYRLEPLDDSTQEYRAVLNDFQQAGLTVYQIERLHNKYLHDKYRSEQDRLKRLRSSNFDLNERYLYHGTSAPKDRICEEGLDARLSRMGSFGRGIYFSDNPSKCIQYTGQKREWENILICRVILGDSKIYPPKSIDPDLIREPERENGSGDRRYYDSVTGEPIDFKEFVVYENSRSMIDYIITYKVGQSAALAGVPRKPAENQRLTPAGYTETEHMETIERVRESVRRQRCLEQGTPYIEPSETEKEADRKKWKRLMFTNNTVLQPEDDAAIDEIINSLVSDFLQVTQSDSRVKARKLIKEANMDLNTAVEKYYSTF